MTLAYEDCDRPLKVFEKWAEYAQHLRERVLEEEGKRKKVVGQLESQGVELEGVHTELAAARAEVARLMAESSMCGEDALMEVSHLQAQAEAVERKAAEVAEDVVAAKTIALFEYQSSAKFEQIC